MADAEKKSASRKSTAKSGKASPGRKTPQSGRSSPGKKSPGKKTPVEKGKTPEPSAEAEGKSSMHFISVTPWPCNCSRTPQRVQRILLLAYGSAAGLETCFALVSARSTMCGLVSKLQVGDQSIYKSVYTSPAETRLLLSRRERWTFSNHGMVLTLNYWLRPQFFNVVIRTHANNLKWLAKGPYQKNNPAGSEVRTRDP